MYLALLLDYFCALEEDKNLRFQVCSKQQKLQFSISHNDIHNFLLAFEDKSFVKAEQKQVLKYFD